MVFCGEYGSTVAVDATQAPHDTARAAFLLQYEQRMGSAPGVQRRLLVPSSRKAHHQLLPPFWIVSGPRAGAGSDLSAFV
jgi:hypothetical protein